MSVPDDTKIKGLKGSLVHTLSQLEADPNLIPDLISHIENNSRLLLVRHITEDKTNEIK